MYEFLYEWMYCKKNKVADAIKPRWTKAILILCDENELLTLHTEKS
jgi:hypothetical protein